MMKMSIFPVLAQSRILLKIVILDHRGHVEDENVNFSKKMLARSRILLKIVIFDHRGHVQAKNFICCNKYGQIQDFAVVV